MENLEFDFNGFELKSLTKKEMIDFNGGGIWDAILAGLVVSLVENIDEIRQGISDGINHTPRY